MSTLDDLNAGPGGMAGFVSALSRRMRPVSRRDVLVGATVAATALATKPKEYALTPVAAYATICGPGNTAASGWTVFCATVNKGVNTCPPGSFAAGWWKAADSSWCGGGYRYIVDCNASCSKCTTGCSDNMCDSKCWSCSCGTGSTATCDQRRVCCNAFRYGQCNTQIKCSGGVHCRVVSCVAPYQWTQLHDDVAVRQPHQRAQRAEPAAVGPDRAEVHRDGRAGVATSRPRPDPQRAVGDGRGSYVAYQGGSIYWTAATGARGRDQHHQRPFGAPTGARGRSGLPDGRPGQRPHGRRLDPDLRERRHHRQRQHHDPGRLGRPLDRLGADGREAAPRLPRRRNQDLATAAGSSCSRAAPSSTPPPRPPRWSGASAGPSGSSRARDRVARLPHRAQRGPARRRLDPALREGRDHRLHHHQHAGGHRRMYAAWVAAGRRAGRAAATRRSGRWPPTPAARSQIFQGGELWALGSGPRHDGSTARCCTQWKADRWRDRALRLPGDRHGRPPAAGSPARSRAARSRPDAARPAAHRGVPSGSRRVTRAVSSRSSSGTATRREVPMRAGRLTDA